MNLSERLLKHKAEEGTLREALQPYASLFSSSSSIEFIKFELENHTDGSRSVVFHFDVYRYDGHMECAVADRYTHAIPIEWLNLPLDDLTERFRRMYAREKANRHWEAEAREGADFSTAFIPQEGFFAHLRLGMALGNKGDWDGAIAE